MYRFIGASCQYLTYMRLFIGKRWIVEVIREAGSLAVQTEHDGVEVYNKNERTADEVEVEVGRVLWLAFKEHEEQAEIDRAVADEEEDE